MCEGEKKQRLLREIHLRALDADAKKQEAGITIRAEDPASNRGDVEPQVASEKDGSAVRGLNIQPDGNSD